MTDQVTTPRLVIATRNEGKANEIRNLLKGTPVQLLLLTDFEIVGEAEEAEDSYEGNAISKARYYALITGAPVLADDSGLEVAALNWAPGIRSARYAGAGASDRDRRQYLLGQIAAASSTDRRARFVCSVALVRPDQEILHVTIGTCEGTIIDEERGDSGFGYDPIFVPKGYVETFAQLSEAEKNRISHRGKAITLMREFLLENDWSA